MINAQLPIIFEFRHLAALLGRTPQYLASVVNSPGNHYRIFEIPKRSGGRREIAAPYPALLYCQQWINKNILPRGSVHESAHGFRKGRSIVTNASPHLGKRCLLKIDLLNFFPSISISKVIKVFCNLGYPRNISFYLARLCCLNDALGQGAATSPSLSNIIARPLDARLDGLAKKWNCQYTRYADDLTFSGDRISVRFPEIVKTIVEEEGFRINEEKTKLCRSRGKRVVTGLSVSREKLLIPREYKRRLRQEIHYISNFGFFSHTSKLKIRNPFYIDSVFGKLSFWKWIEPENTFAEKGLRRLSAIMDHLGGKPK
jgi:retron-type reverse transcriptase